MTYRKKTVELVDLLRAFKVRDFNRYRNIDKAVNTLIMAWHQRDSVRNKLLNHEQGGGIE